MLRRIGLLFAVLALLLIGVLPVAAQADEIATAAAESPGLLAVAVSGWAAFGVTFIALIAMLMGYRETAVMLAKMIPADFVSEQTDYWYKRLKDDDQRWNDFLLPVIGAAPRMWGLVQDEIKAGEGVDKVKVEPLE